MSTIKPFHVMHQAGGWQYKATYPSSFTFSETQVGMGKSKMFDLSKVFQGVLFIVKNTEH